MDFASTSGPYNLPWTIAMENIMVKLWKISMPIKCIYTYGKLSMPIPQRMVIHGLDIETYVQEETISFIVLF